ncbi:MAG: hypothetical protein ACKO23_08895, partial [Gemmataceae bacterium]
FDRNFPGVFLVDRLRDGTTFIACRNQITVVDAKGAAVMTYPYMANSILAAKRFRDGTSAFVSYSGNYVKLDRNGKEIKNHQIPQWGLFSPNGAEILPGDRIVIADAKQNKVVEMDLDGKNAWECPVPFPLIPYQTASGNILLAGNNNSAIYEIDRKGKLIKDWANTPFKPYRVLRR